MMKLVLMTTLVLLYVAGPIVVLNGPPAMAAEKGKETTTPGEIGQEGSPSSLPYSIISLLLSINSRQAVLESELKSVKKRLEDLDQVTDLVKKSDDRSGRLDERSGKLEYRVNDLEEFRVSMAQKLQGIEDSKKRLESIEPFKQDISRQFASLSGFVGDYVRKQDELLVKLQKYSRSAEDFDFFVGKVLDMRDQLARVQAQLRFLVDESQKGKGKLGTAESK